MSLEKQWVLSCGKCCKFIVYDNLIFKDDIVEIRKFAKSSGWASSNTEDICPECRPKETTKND